MSRLIALLWCSVVLTGCQMPGDQAASDSPAVPPVQQQAQEQADRLSQAMVTPPPAAAAPTVRWIVPQPSATAKTVEVLSRTEPAVADVVPTATASATPTVTLDRAALLAQLRDQVVIENGPALERALAAVALSLLHPDRRLDPALLEGLTPAQRKAVTLYQQLALQLGQAALSERQPFDAEAAAAQIQQVFGSHPLKIRNAQFCKRVHGFGVYEPFETNTLVAGRQNPMIVYVEVDHFQSTRLPTGRFVVRLKQEVVLYNQSDGLAVWRQPPVEVVDESFNQRRDFFVVQLIRLPANLTVGRYLLKVSLTDLGGGSVDETTLALQVVADQSMVGTGEARGGG